MELNKLTPAQSLFILHPLASTDKILLKYSLLDLVINGILRVYQENRLPHPKSNKTQPYTFISRGDHFDEYVPSRHQEPFMQHFREGNHEFQVKLLFKEVYDQCFDEKGYRFQYLFKELKEAGYFYKSRLLELLGFYWLNSKGQRLRKTLDEELKEADQLLPEYDEHNKSRVKETLRQLGSNVLLLNNLDESVMEKLRPIFKELGQNREQLTTPIRDWNFFYHHIHLMVAMDFLSDSVHSNFAFDSGEGALGGFGEGGMMGGGDAGGGDAGGI